MTNKSTIDNQWLFIDESGKPEVYSARGENLVTKNKASRFLVLAAIRSEDHLALQQDITEFRLSLLKNKSMTRIFSSSYSLDTFHAQTDYAEVKEQFYCFITTLAIKVDVLVIEKIPCYDPLKQNPGRLYGVMAGQLIKNVIKQKIPKSFLVGKIAN